MLYLLFNTYGRRAFPVAGPTSGTHCQMNSEIRRVMSTASNNSLKQSCSALTSVTSAFIFKPACICQFAQLRSIDVTRCMLCLDIRLFHVITFSIYFFPY